MTGRVLKLLSGIYTVKAQNEQSYLCTAKGSFRARGIAPVPGDEVTIQAFSDHTGRIEQIHPRKNYLIRPNIANVDLICYVSSFGKPTPYAPTIDKMLILAKTQGITPVLIFNKEDLPGDRARELAKLYESLGYCVLRVSAAQGGGLDSLHAVLRGKTAVFAGNTGVGKSSILNALYPALSLQTGAISDKLGRGRHTTRHIEFYETAEGLLADTPGFGALELEGSPIKKAELLDCFPEFLPHAAQCAFQNCVHINEHEEACGVKSALARGEISRSRYESYCMIYQRLKEEEAPGTK